MLRAPFQPSPCARQLEERCLNAWPGVQEALYDGWLVRFSNGYTKRANCAVPFFPGTLDVEAKVAWCEGEYRRRGLPAIFKILPFSQPPDLERHLEGRGYGNQDHTLVLWRDLPADGDGSGFGARVREAAGSWYLAQYARLNRIHRVQLPGLRRILARVAGEVGYAAAVRGGRLAACGLGILDNGHLGLYGIATDPEWRRQGLGRDLACALLAWGASRGAGRAYLQVRVDNAAARSLYRQLGFRRAYEYTYRVQPPS